MKKYTDPIIDFFIKHVLVVSLIIGIGLLIIGYSGNIAELWENVFITAGTVILSSGVFASITKSEHFVKIFKNELRKVIYSEEHLNKRTDLEEMWDKISETLCKKKFSNISKKLLKAIKDYYLPIDEDFYYKDYKIDVDIERDEENPDYIDLQEEIETTIVLENKNGFEYYFKIQIPIVSGEENLTTYKLESLIVNGSKVSNFQDKVKIEKKNNFLTVSYRETFKGKKEYNVVRKEKKKYSLKVNPYKGHQAVWLYQNFYLDLNYPKDMEIEWMDMGVLGNWKTTRKDTSTSNRLKANYNGLIFRKQGFMLIFK